MIGIDVAGPTSLGTGTGQVLLGGGTLTLPSWARSIVAVRPKTSINGLTPGQAVTSALTLESDDFSIQPYQVIVNPINSILGATGVGFVAEPKWYAVNCPVPGGSELKVIGNALRGNSVAPEMSCEIIISDQIPRQSQAHARIGTLTATGTTANINVAEPTYTITGGSKVVELYGMVVHRAVAQSDSIFGWFEFTSNDLVRPTPLKIATNPISVFRGTTGSSLADGIARVKVDVDIKSPCLFENSIQMVQAPATTGDFITGLLYV